VVVLQLMSIEFLGHKKNLLPFILTQIQRTGANDLHGNFVDLFCGTAAVSTAFKRAGWRVIANDHLYWCSLSAEALLLNDDDPPFSGVQQFLPKPQRKLLNPSVYETVLSYLNGLPAKKGFIYRNYSPAAKSNGDGGRMYFTENNAKRIDAIRVKIEEWGPRLTKGERALLLWDLIRASNAVSNIAGTYGCYLKYWKERAKQPLLLMRSALNPSSQVHEVFCEDANRFVEMVEGAIIYADPPYTKRQYAAYYHLLETIALADEPELTGSTGLRPWEEKASDYCYRKRAPHALQDLVSKLNCKHFFLSYNEDGQIPHPVILEILKGSGVVKFFEAPYRRYKSSLRPHKGDGVVERLYHLSF
jgi:adenine-specific DNA-methyltransferase